MVACNYCQFPRTDVAALVHVFQDRWRPWTGLQKSSRYVCFSPRERRGRQSGISHRSRFMKLNVLKRSSTIQNWSRTLIRWLAGNKTSRDSGRKSLVRRLSRQDLPAGGDKIADPPLKKDGDHSMFSFHSFSVIDRRPFASCPRG